MGCSVQTVIWRLQLSSNCPWPLSDSIGKVKLGLFPTPNLPFNKNRKLKRKLAWLKLLSVFERHSWGRWVWRKPPDRELQLAGDAGGGLGEEPRSWFQGAKELRALREGSGQFGLICFPFTDVRTRKTLRSLPFPPPCVFFILL